jgi:molybdopterin molybdotransferase
LIDYEEAFGRMEPFAKPLEEEEIPIASSGGRILAEPLIAPFSLPRFDNSAVDGYAIGSAGQEFEVVETVAAGDSVTRSLRDRTAARIFTGAQVPPNAFAVVMQEDVVRSGDCIRLKEIPNPGQHIRRAGEEVVQGQVVMPNGTPLNPAAVSLLAGFGMERVRVHRLPRVAIVVTGAELVAPPGPLGEGEIYESNSFGLIAALASHGITPIRIRSVGDSSEETISAMREALHSADVVISTGGVSVGDKDLIRGALQQIGVREVFWKVAIKPGKPLYFGESEGKVVFGLPGNPLSVLAMYTLFVAPLLHALAGRPLERPFSIHGELTDKVDHKPGRMELVPAIHKSGNSMVAIEPISGQGSHMLTGMANATGWIEVPKDANGLSKGDIAPFYPFGKGMR